MPGLVIVFDPYKTNQTLWLFDNSLKNNKSIKLPHFTFVYILLIKEVIKLSFFNIKIPKTIITIPGAFNIHQIVKKNTFSVMKIFSKISGFVMNTQNTY